LEKHSCPSAIYLRLHALYSGRLDALPPMYCIRISGVAALIWPWDAIFPTC